jgi:hypothetical protein
MKSRSVLRRAVLLGLTAFYAAGCGGARLGDRPNVTVDEIIAGSFHRVAGPRERGSDLDTTQAADWGSYVVGLPTVDFDGTLFRMWFAATPQLAPGESPYLYRSSIGLATSRDGLNWTIENEGRPVFAQGPPGSFDSLAVSHPSVLRVNGVYMMWYGGADGTYAPTGVRVERLGLATSSDGIHWTRQHDGRPVLDIGPDQSVDSIQATGAAIIKDPAGFRMWYGAFNGVHRLATATSRDGIQWTKDDRGAVTGLQADTGALGPSVYFDGRKYLMLYSVIADRQWVMVAATSADGWSWTPVAGRAPVLGPPAPDSFDSAGSGRNQSVHPSEIVVRGDRVLVWYTAEDGRPPNAMRVGLMESSVLPPP